MIRHMRRDLCEYCDGRLEYRHVRAPFHYKSSIIYIDHIPAWVCEKCGERYFDASVYKQLEVIARHRSKIRKTVSFPLADFNKSVANAS